MLSVYKADEKHCNTAAGSVSTQIFFPKCYSDLTFYDERVSDKKLQ